MVSVKKRSWTVRMCAFPIILHHSPLNFSLKFYNIFHIEFGDCELTPTSCCCIDAYTPLGDWLGCWVIIVAWIFWLNISIWFFSSALFLCCLRSLALRFWNQIFTWRSDNPKLAANSAFLPIVMYLLMNVNSFSNSIRWWSV